MEEESFIDAFGDVPEDLSGTDSRLYVFRVWDFGDWRRRVRNAHEREVDGGVDAMTDAQLADHGLVRLPTDADGEYIHIGDVMEWCDSGETLTVEGIGRDVLFYIDGENAEWTAARNKRHRHEPTVEDVLCELLDKVDDDRAGQAEIIAEYAAKLRLAKEGE